MTAARTFLIIEDEPMIAMVLEDYLDLLGHTALEPAGALDAALAAIAAGGFDAAIVDVNLGGEQSWPAADALRAAGIPFMIASGSGPDTLPERLAGVPLLMKPYSMQTLETRIGDLFPA